MKFFPAPSPRRRSTLLALHRSGVLQVFRRHSLFRLWVPLRDAAAGGDPLVG